MSDDDKPKRGRPATGKRSNPAYSQTSYYLLKTTIRDFQIEALRRGYQGDLSDIVEALVQAWIRGEIRVSENPDT